MAPNQGVFGGTRGRAAPGALGGGAPWLRAGAQSVALSQSVSWAQDGDGKVPRGPSRTRKRPHPASRAERGRGPRALRGEGAVRGVVPEGWLLSPQGCAGLRRHVCQGISTERRTSSISLEKPAFGCQRATYSPSFRPPHLARAPQEELLTGIGTLAGGRGKRSGRLSHNPQRQPRYGFHSSEWRSPLVGPDSSVGRASDF